MVQETSEGTKVRRGETNRSKWSGRVRSEENIKQKKSTRSNEVSNVMERVYSREQYMGKKRELEECKESSSRI